MLATRFKELWNCDPEIFILLCTHDLFIWAQSQSTGQGSMLQLDAGGDPVAACRQSIGHLEVDLPEQVMFHPCLDCSDARALF